MDIIENTGFDIIGGGLGEPLHVGSNKSFFNNWLNHGKYRVQKGSNGYCLKREFGFYGNGFVISKCDKVSTLDFKVRHFACDTISTVARVQIRAVNNMPNILKCLEADVLGGRLGSEK